jgi:transposase InsO family protein
VDQHKKERRLNRWFQATQLPKSTYYYRKNRPDGPSEDDPRLMQHVRAIIRDHQSRRNSCDGYRRILPELEERSGETVNHKRLRRLLSNHEMGLPRCLPKAKPSPVRAILQEASGQLNLVQEYLGTGLDPEPLEVFSTDFTELNYAEGTRTAHLMALVDVGSRCALGWAVGPGANRKLALQCWEQVRARTAALGRTLEGTILHSDLDSVRAGYDWLLQVLLDDALRVSYSERGAKDNPWIESQRRNFCEGRMKTEESSRIVEAQTLQDLEDVIDERFRYYNRRRRHTQIGDQPPMNYLANLLQHPELTCSIASAA